MVAEFPRGAEIGDAALCKKNPPTIQIKRVEETQDLNL